jgi:hypothetical protein
MRVQQTVIVSKPLDAVFGYLMSFHRVEGGTEVTYAADFTFKGPARFVAPLLRPALERLGQQAQWALRRGLEHVQRRPAGRLGLSAAI